MNDFHFESTLKLFTDTFRNLDKTCCAPHRFSPKDLNQQPSFIPYRTPFGALLDFNGAWINKGHFVQQQQKKGNILL
ncbi:hypothetical protein RO3G_13761 [Rhizopus delemar RA 99-880]|uniref:Uncharacterized protein n=1 Tax=Rhizopus delemar (strain RA 99-880 / ATCC MYA-4621 / FGSC 9543 / NRRL 43880) TaxID=246409 RepID=I1CKS0_RHIO9|nr:hypothetical protein RO3G_13761 [Rhizopus delemar RA 99-880]|eukprot:EIE89050.1 hypothetical protein RO3G_13761 [Rhizopus delemar RA 99-880]